MFYGHSPASNFTVSAQDIVPFDEFENYILKKSSPFCSEMIVTHRCTWLLYMAETIH